MTAKTKLKNKVIAFSGYVFTMTFIASLMLVTIFAEPIEACQVPLAKQQVMVDRPKLPSKVIFPTKKEKVTQVKQEVKPTKQELGNFNITFYDLSVESCGKNANDPAYGVTYSGVKAKQGTTVAVDPRVIPLGTLLYIEGLGYRIAQDIGGGIKGSRIDVFVDKFEYGNKDMVTGKYKVYKIL